MNPRVALWHEPPPMEPGAPMPSLFCNRSGDLYCAYYVRSLAEDQSPDKSVVLRFNVVLHFRFGHPNDEVLDAHPLYAYGLKHYEFHIVEHSPLIAELEARNYVHRRHVPGIYSTCFKHFVLAFHDETLEVVAKNGIVAGRSNLPPEKAVTTFVQPQTP